MNKVSCRTSSFTYIGESKISWKSRGAKHKPETNGKVGSAVKQYAETTGHDIHPNYPSILETGVKTNVKRLLLESLHSFLDKISVNERAPFPRVYASLVSTLRINDQWRLLLFICIQWLAEYIPLKKVAEGGRKFSFNVFRSVLNPLVKILNENCIPLVNSS